ncbi:MAG: hypothetical protein ACRDZ8_19800 [Acidimicrobiales bacterium]
MVQLDVEFVANLDNLARRPGSKSLRAFATGRAAVLEADDSGAMDAQLQQASRRQPQDPVLVETARRLAADTAPAW